MTEVTSGLRVRMEHVRAAKICWSGTRAFFDKHGIDWRDFTRDGIDAERLEDIGDPIALRAVAEARREAEHGR